MKSFAPLLCFLIALHFSLTVFGQRYRAKDMGVERGLSQTSVRCIMEDEQGFIWIGTQDGLNRFDGYEFRLFRKRPYAQGQLPVNDIGALYQSKDGFIWVGHLSEGGLTRFDPRHESFVKVYDSKADSIRWKIPVSEIVEDSKGNLWLGTSGDLFRIDRGTEGKLKAELFEESKGWGVVNDLFRNGEGKMWLATNIMDRKEGNHQGGLGLIETASKTFSKEWYNPKQSGLLPDNEIFSLLEDREGKLWVGCIDSGLFVCQNPRADQLEFKRIFHAKDHKRTSGDNFIRVLEEDSKGNIWVGSHAGLWWIPNGQEDSLYLPSFINQTQLPLKTIRAITEDQAANIWVGADEGCYMLTPSLKPFDHFYHQPQNPQSIASNDVLDLLERSNGEIWVGSGDKGITRIIPTTQGYAYIHYNKESGHLNSNIILDLMEDSRGRVWVSTFSGCYVMEFADNALGGEATISWIHHDPANLHSIGSNYIYNVIEEDGSYWLADYIKGLEHLTYEGGEWKATSYGSERSDPFSLGTGRINEVSRDAEGGIWAMGGKGISLLYREHGKVLGFRHIRYGAENGIEARPICFFRDSKGVIWVGADGLNRIELQEGWKEFSREGNPELPYTIEYYGEEDGLANNFIYNIIEDPKGRLWITTNGGLSCFDPETETFKNYTKEDGLQSNEFSGDAATLGKSGNIYVGGINGFNVFHPDSLKASTFQPRVELHSLQLFNEEVFPGSILSHSKLKLEQGISYLESLEISHKDDVISLGFAGNDYSAVEKQKYQYRLLGLDERWIEDQGVRSATYTDLAPGQYTFEVKGSNADELWSDKVRRLDIYVKPPWWQTIWAYLFYTVALSLLGYGLVRLRIQAVRREMRVQARLEQAKLEEREQTRAETSRDFHDEAGNRITKIGLYANLLRESIQEKPESASFLDKIEGHTKELSARMRDFIWVLDPKQDELSSTLLRIRDFGAELFEHTNTEFQTLGDWGKIPEIRLAVQVKRHLLMIAKEAFHNALKYAEASMVRMYLRFEDEKMYWKVVDNGLGFNIEKSGQGTGLRNMRNRAAEMGADFAIQSNPGMGTEILLTLDLVQAEE